MPSPLRQALVAAIFLALACGAPAQSDRSAERATRRLQLQLQDLQQQVDAAQAAKAKAEADKTAADKQLAEQGQQVTRLKGQVGQMAVLQEKLRAAEAKRAEIEAAKTALEKQLDEQKRSNEAALAAKTRELEGKTREVAALAKVRDDQTVEVAECARKNERLIKLSAELLERWRTKSVSDVLHQKEPVLGLGDVEMFNLVQEYRDKADAERYSPPPPTTKR